MSNSITVTNFVGHYLNSSALVKHLNSCFMVVFVWFGMYVSAVFIIAIYIVKNYI